MSETNAIDNVETLLAYLICADAEALGIEWTERTRTNKLHYEEMDVSSVLKFDPMAPRHTYTVQGVGTGSDRLFCTDSRLLINPAQDTIGAGAEMAVIRPDCALWAGFRPLRKLPRGVWVGARRPSLYEMHVRRIEVDGRSHYLRRIAALDSAGRATPVLFEGSSGDSGIADSRQLVACASVIEDAHRAHALTATISEATSIVLPVPIGEHRDLFALRDAPLTAAGRRKAILHWVAKHTRRTTDSKTDVRAHWRGTREMVIDGLTVRLATNDVELAAA